MKITDEIRIDAPQSIVWNVTEDIESWPQWVPAMSSVKRIDEGPLDVGCSALIKQTGFPESKWTVTSLTRGESFTWESRIRGIDMIATHKLATIESATLNNLLIEISGTVALLLWPLLRILVKRSLKRENIELKSKCESLDL